MMSIPEIGSLILGKLNERLTRTTSSDLPRLAGLDQADLRDLRRRRKGKRCRRPTPSARLPGAERDTARLPAKPGGQERAMGRIG
jgi:hypothetical protein